MLRSYLELGMKWARIARNFKGRTVNAIKNRFDLILKKKPKKLNERDYILGLVEQYSNTLEMEGEREPE